jgi:hypothetical protein
LFSATSVPVIWDKAALSVCEPTEGSITSIFRVEYQPVKCVTRSKELGIIVRMKFYIALQAGLCSGDLMCLLWGTNSVKASNLSKPERHWLVIVAGLLCVWSIAEKFSMNSELLLMSFQSATLSR